MKIFLLALCQLESVWVRVLDLGLLPLGEPLGKDLKLSLECDRTLRRLGGSVG